MAAVLSVHWSDGAVGRGHAVGNGARGRVEDMLA
jgi:hypothetical protein